MTKIDDLDPNLEKLLAALRAFPGIYTTSSCGGHENPVGCQYPAGEWYVSFRIMRDEKGYLVEDGWLSTEFLVWMVNDELKELSGLKIHLVVTSGIPTMSADGPGNALTFDIESWDNGISPDELARQLIEYKKNMRFFPDEC